MFESRHTRRWVLLSGALLGAGPLHAAVNPAATDEIIPTPSPNPLKSVSIAKLSKIEVLPADLKNRVQRKFVLSFEVSISLGLPENIKTFECHVLGLTRAFGNYENKELTGKYYLVRFLKDFSQPYKEGIEIWNFAGSQP
jgi:hypothetical protein